MFGENRLIAYGNYSAAAGQASLAAARASGVRYSPNTPPAGSMPYYDRLSATDQEKLGSIKGWMDRESAAKAKFEAQARVDILNGGYSELYPEVSTFFQNVKNLPQDQQDTIMNSLREQANASVDKAFDSSASFVTAVRNAKLKNYDDQFALLKKGEDQALQNNLGEIGRGTATSLRDNFYRQFQANAGNGGQLRDFADRMIEEYDRQSKEETDQTQLALDKASQSRQYASDITNLSAEQDLQDISYGRTAARAQRLSELMGLNASQDLLLQSQTALDTTLVPTNSGGAPKATSGSFVRAPYGNRTSDAGIAANARAGYGATTPVAPKSSVSSVRAPYGARTSTAGKAANARAGYFLP